MGTPPAPTPSPTPPDRTRPTAPGNGDALPVALTSARTVRLDPEHEAQAVRALGAMLARLEAGSWGGHEAA